MTTYTILQIIAKLRELAPFHSDLAGLADALVQETNPLKIAGIGMQAELPPHYRYGRDAMDNVNTGQRLAAQAIAKHLNTP